MHKRRIAEGVVADERLSPKVPGPLQLAEGLPDAASISVKIEGKRCDWALNSGVEVGTDPRNSSILKLEASVKLSKVVAKFPKTQMVSFCEAKAPPKSVFWA